MVRNFRIGKTLTKDARKTMANIKGKIGTVMCPFNIFYPREE